MNRVGLQEYFEKILEFRFGAFDKIIEARFVAIEKATQLAAKLESDIQRERASELARRMEGLNNETGRIAADKLTYLSKDSHTGDMKELHAKLEALDSRVQSLDRLAAVACFIAIALPVVINIVIRMLEKPRP
jgi:polyhydroxyalkanoate synthesis regulator phasin